MEKVVYAPPEETCKVLVSGAGYSAFDGTYEQDGEAEGKPRYRLKNTDKTLYYDPFGKSWNLDEFGYGPGFNEESKYLGRSKNAGEELNDPRKWSSWFNKSLDPAPTVTEICTWRDMNITLRSHPCPFDKSWRFRGTKHQGQFVCKKSWCIDEVYACDGEVNCRDASDEDQDICGE